MDGFEFGQGVALGEVREQVQEHCGVEAAGERDTPTFDLAPRLKTAQKPGRQINRGPSHIFLFVQKQM